MFEARCFFSMTRQGFCLFAFDVQNISLSEPCNDFRRKLTTSLIKFNQYTFLMTESNLIAFDVL